MSETAETEQVTEDAPAETEVIDVEVITVEDRVYALEQQIRDHQLQIVLGIAEDILILLMIAVLAKEVARLGRVVVSASVS